MVRLLAKIGFKKAILKYAFSQQSFPADKNDLELGFIDSEGNRYYRYKMDEKIPVVRLGQMQRVHLELRARLSRNELKAFIEAMSDSLLQFQSTEGKTRWQHISKVGFLVEEMKLRDQILIHEDLLLELIAVTYIREDEIPTVWSDSIHDEKLKQFKKDSMGGLKDFFCKTNLQELSPYCGLSEEEFQEYLSMGRYRIKAMENMLKIFTSESKSENSKNDSGKT